MLQTTSSKEDLEKCEKTLDVFISYRRSDGSALASLLNVILKSKGYTVFFDVKTLKAGKFDDNILRSIKEARNFVLVLTPKALDRCINDNESKDWIHKEIVAAIKFECNIIPIFDRFEWPKEEDLPQDMREVLRFNGIKYVHELQDAVIEELQTFIKRKTDENEHVKPERDKSREQLELILLHQMRMHHLQMHHFMP